MKRDRTPHEEEAQGERRERHEEKNERGGCLGLDKRGEGEED